MCVYEGVYCIEVFSGVKATTQERLRPSSHFTYPATLRITLLLVL